MKSKRGHSSLLIMQNMSIWIYKTVTFKVKIVGHLYKIYQKGSSLNNMNSEIELNRKK